MRVQRFQTQLIVYVILFFSFLKSAEAMLARSLLHDAAPIFSRSLLYIPIEPIISRSFSRYVKFDGESDDVYKKGHTN